MRFWNCSSSSRAEARSLASRFESGALPLAAGELARLALEEMLDAEQRRRPLRLRLLLRLLDALRLQREDDVLVDGEVRIERVALEDHGDAALARGEVVDDAAADEDVAGGGLLEAGDHPQERGFSGARGAEEDEELALSALQVDVVDGADVSAFEDFGELSGLYDRHASPGRTLCAPTDSRADSYAGRGTQRAPPRNATSTSRRCAAPRHPPLSPRPRASSHLSPPSRT